MIFSEVTAFGYSDEANRPQRRRSITVRWIDL